MAYQTPPHAVRSLSPITELTTPASARSIALPLVEKAYDYNDYKDESPIQPLTPDVLALVNGHPNGFRHDDNDDRASTHSEGSTRTVVPSSTEPSPLPPVSSDSPLPSPPSALRPFHSPTASLPPPPRPISVKGERSSQPSTPHSAAVPLDPPAVHEPTARLLEGDRPDHHYGEGTDGHDGPHDDEDDRMSVSTAGIAGIGSGTFAETAKKKKGRPKSLHGTRDPPLSPIASSAAFPSHHASLVDIPNIPNIPPTPDAGGTLGRPASKGAKSPTTSPQRSGPSSPKSRPSTLKKRPNSLHTSRPSSWHSQKSVKVPKNGGRKADKSKGKGKSKIVDMEASGSSNDDHSDTIRSPPLPTRTMSPRKRIPSILLSLFDSGSARQSREASLVSSPTGSDIPPSPASPASPSLMNTAEDPEWSAIQPPPQQAIRTSGTFGIRDDGSVHLLRNDDDHPLPRMSTSSEPSQAGRQRRDSDNGTVKSGVLDRRILYVNNRDSIDETDENEARRRSLTPFELDNPLSPLESVLSGRTSEETPLAHEPERKSVEGPRNFLLSAGRSDASQRAQSPSIEQSSVSTPNHGTATASLASSRHVAMMDESTQTSVPPSPSPRRPLPQPPLSAGSHTLPNGAVAPDSRHGQYSNAAGSEKVRPSSLPPPPLTSAYPQPRPDPPTGQTPELPLLIASHLLSSHAAALMRQSAGLVEGAEMMKRLADESMQWGAMLLSMASSAAGPQASSVPSFPTVPMPMPQAEARSGREKQEGTRNQVDGLPTSAAGLLFDSLYPSRPVVNPLPRRTTDLFTSPRSEREVYPQPQPQPHSGPQSQDSHMPRSSAESDRYTRLPARTRRSQIESRTSGLARAGQRPSPLESHDHRRTSLGYLLPDSAKRLSSEIYHEVHDIGRRGFEELHKAEEVWVRGMRDLRSFLDAGPDSASSNPEPRSPRSSTEKHSERSEEVLRRKSHVSTASAKRSSLRRPISISSAVRTDESFLPQSADLGGASTGGTKTDESFLPQSADLITPIDDSTFRPTRPRIQTRPSLSPPPLPPPISDIGKGYDPAQIHTLLGDHFRPFDIPPPLPTGEKTYSGPLSALSTASSGARKLRKRGSATSEKLRQSSGGSVGGTIKSKKKRHWWSRRSRVTGSEDMHEPPVTAY